MKRDDMKKVLIGICACVTTGLIVWFRKHCAKDITVMALAVGVIGAVISVGDDIRAERARRDRSEPWVSIRAGLKDLETFDVSIEGMDISQLNKGERGYEQIMEVIERNVDMTIHGTPIALWAQARGTKEVIAKRFVRQPVYFGIVNIVNKDRVLKLLEDMTLLKFWVGEYRHRYYVLKGLKFILVSFVLQLLATLRGASTELKVTDKSAP